MDRKKILLIYPPFFRLFDDEFSLNVYPLGIGYLAGMVKTKTSWDVKSYNSDFNPHSKLEDVTVTFSFRTGKGHRNYCNNLSATDAPIWREIRQTIEKVKPDVVGITSLSQTFKAASRVAGIAKSVDSRITIIIGGPHPSMVGGEVLACNDIDIGVKGEGEKTILELLEYFEKKKSLRDVKGIVFRSNGAVVDTGPRDYIADLDSLCFPHDIAPEVLIDYKDYPPTAFHSVFASRGCPFSCTFCGSRNIWSRKVRFRSPRNVAEEIAHLKTKGSIAVRFADDTFGINKTWTENLCAELKRQCPGLKWKCEMNVSAINDEILSTMKEAGCHMIEIGIESGDNRVLREIQKNITIEKALDACKLIVRHGIELQAYFMAGFPQDTEDSLENTRNAIRKINGYVCFSVYSPFPGSRLFSLCKEKKLIDDAYDVCMHNYQSLEGFSETIPKERFKILVSEIIRDVDRKNTYNRIKRIFSPNSLWRIKEIGIRRGIKKGLQVLAKPFSKN
jgi:anaerobic magnesium-protoporphyrin IX monomethyl ester cyclase